MKEIDTEVDLIKRLHEDLKTLSPQAQKRVLDYLRSKFSNEEAIPREASKFVDGPAFPPARMGTFKG